MPTRDNVLAIVLLTVITFLVYYDSFNNSFVHDDVVFITENQSIRKFSLGGMVSYFIDRDTTSSLPELSRQVWRPLVTASFALDYKLWKLNPRFYHIENAVLHVINAGLVYMLTFLILRNGLAALLASLVFAIHPVQTEAVTWISGRSNCLFLLFFLSALISHIKNRKYVFIFFTLALLSKEMAISLPLVLILYDSHFHRVKKRLAYYSSFFAVAVFYLLARVSVLGKMAQIDISWQGRIFYNILTMMKAVCGYIRLLFLPTNLRVGYYLDISKSATEPDTLAAIIVLALVAVSYFVFRRKKEVSFYILWFFITLIPVYNIVPFNAIMAERFLYLPIIGFASLFAIFFVNLIKTFKRRDVARIAISAVLTVIFMIYGFATISRNVEWRNDIRFYSKEVERSPCDPIAHNNLGLTYAKYAVSSAGDKRISRAYEELAIKEYKKAIDLDPLYYPAYRNLANFSMAVGRYDLAIENFKKSLAIKEDPVSYNNLAVSCYYKGMFDETILYSKKAIMMKGDYADAYVNLGNAYYMKRKLGR